MFVAIGFGFVHPACTSCCSVIAACCFILCAGAHCIGELSVCMDSASLHIDSFVSLREGRLSVLMFITTSDRNLCLPTAQRSSITHTQPAQSLEPHSNGLLRPRPNLVLLKPNLHPPSTLGPTASTPATATFAQQHKLRPASSARAATAPAVYATAASLLPLRTSRTPRLRRAIRRNRSRDRQLDEKREVVPGPDTSCTSTNARAACRSRRRWRV